MPSPLEQMVRRPAVSVYSPGRLLPGTAANARPIPRSSRELIASIADEAKRRSGHPVGSVQARQATRGQSPWEGLYERVTSSPAYAPNVEATKQAEIQAQEDLPWWKQGLGMVFANPVVSNIIKPLGAFQIPQRAITLGIEELASALGHEPSKLEGDTRSNWEKVTDLESTYGMGELFDTGNAWADRILGFAGDVATDPLTYLSGGATKLAEGATAAERAARASKVDEVLQAVDEASVAREAVSTASKQGGMFGDAYRRMLTADVAEQRVNKLAGELADIPRVEPIATHMTPGTRARAAHIASFAHRDKSIYEKFAGEIEKVTERGFAYASPELREALGITAPSYRFAGKQIPRSERLATRVGKVTGGIRAGAHEVPGLRRVGEIRAPAGAEEAYKSLALGGNTMEPLRAATVIDASQLVKRGLIVEAQAKGELRRTLDKMRTKYGDNATIRQVLHEAETRPDKENEFRDYIQKVLSIYEEHTGKSIDPKYLLDKKTYVPHLMNRDFKRFLDAHKQDKRVEDLVSQGKILSDDLLEGSPLLEKARSLRPKEVGKPTKFTFGGREITLEDGSIQELNDEIAKVFPEFKGKAYMDDPATIGEAYASSLAIDAGADIATREFARSDNPFFKEVTGPMAEALRKRNEALLRSNPVTNYLRSRPYRAGQPLPDIGTPADVPVSEYDQYFGNTPATKATNEARDETMKEGVKLTQAVKGETKQVRDAAVVDLQRVRNQLLDSFKDQIADRGATLKKLDPHIRTLIKAVDGLPTAAKAGSLDEVVATLAQVTALRTKLDQTLRSARSRWGWVLKKEEASGRAALEGMAREMRAAEKRAREALAYLPERMRGEAEQRLRLLNEPVETARRNLEQQQAAHAAARTKSARSYAAAHASFRSSFKDSDKYAAAMKQFNDALEQVHVVRDVNGGLTPATVEAVENVATTPEAAQAAATAVAQTRAAPEVFEQGQLDLGAALESTPPPAAAPAYDKVAAEAGYTERETARVAQRKQAEEALRAQFPPVEVPAAAEAAGKERLSIYLNSDRSLLFHGGIDQAKSAKIKINLAERRVTFRGQDWPIVNQHLPTTGDVSLWIGSEPLSGAGKQTAKAAAAAPAAAAATVENPQLTEALKALDQHFTELSAADRASMAAAEEAAAREVAPAAVVDDVTPAIQGRLQFETPKQANARIAAERKARGEDQQKMVTKELVPPREERKPFKSKWKRQEKGEPRVVTSDFAEDLTVELDDGSHPVTAGWKIMEVFNGRYRPMNAYDSLGSQTYDSIAKAKKAIDDLVERRLQALEGYQGESIAVPLAKTAEAPVAKKGTIVGEPQQRAVAVPPPRPEPPVHPEMLPGEAELRAGGQRPLLPSEAEAGAIPIGQLPKRAGVSRDAAGNVVGTGYDADWQRLQDILKKLDDPTYRRVPRAMQRQYDELAAMFEKGGKYAKQRADRKWIIEDLANQKEMADKLAPYEKKLAEAEEWRANQIESIVYLRQKGEAPEDWIRLTEPTQGFGGPGQRQAFPVQPPTVAGETAGARRGAEVPTPLTETEPKFTVPERMSRGQRQAQNRQRLLMQKTKDAEKYRSRLDDVLNPIEPSLRPQIQDAYNKVQKERQDLFDEMVASGEVGGGSTAVLNPRAIDRLSEAERAEFMDLQDGFDDWQGYLQNPDLTENEVRRAVGSMNSIRLSQRNLLKMHTSLPSAEPPSMWEGLISERPDPQAAKLTKAEKVVYSVEPTAQPTAAELPGGNTALNQAYVDSLNQTPLNPEKEIARRQAEKLAAISGKPVEEHLPPGFDQQPERVAVTPKLEQEAIDDLLKAAEQTKSNLWNEAEKAKAQAQVFENKLLEGQPEADALAKHAAARDAEIVPLGQQATLAHQLEDALTAKQILIEQRAKLVKDSSAVNLPGSGGKWTTIGTLQSNADAILAVARANPDMLDEDLNVVEALLTNTRDGLKRVEGNAAVTKQLQEAMTQIQRKNFPDVVLTTAAKGWDMVGKTSAKKGRKKLMEEGDILVERQMHQMLTNLYNIKKEAGMFGRTFNALTDIFKTYATLSPGFHVRNALSAIFMNTADGVPLRTQLEGAKLWHRYMKPDGIEWLADQSPEIRQAFQATFMSGAGGRYMEKGFAEGRGRLEKVLNTRATRLSQRGGQRVEGSVRLPMALDSLRHGDSMQGAFDRLARVHFDYNDVSKFDAKARRIIPFWTFLSRNLPLQVTEMWQKPGLYMKYTHFVQNMASVDESYTPEYWLQAGAFNTGAHIPNIPGMGGAQGLPVYLAPEVGSYQIDQQMGDLVEALSGRNVGALLSQANPLLTAPAEFATGKDFYTGKTYDETSYSNVGGLMTPAKWAAMALGQTNDAGQVSDKFMNLLRSVNPMMDRTSRVLPQLTGGDEEAKKRQLESIARFIGAPMRTLTPKQQDSEYWRRYYDWLDKHKADLAMAKAG
jgi:hypothetical protein